MKITHAILFGFIQGLTEFLPVSSSGHLQIFQNILKFENLETSYFSFDILLHLATLIAVFIVYYKDIFPLIPAFFTMLGKVFHRNFKLDTYTKNERMAVLVIIATIPLVIAIFINDYVEMIGSYTKAVGAILIFNGIVLFISDKMSKGHKDETAATPKNALVVGLCQLCAIVPGLSRSGSTITGGLLSGYSREFAVRFSFILSIPAIIGANISNVPEMLSNPVPSSDILPYAAGMLTAAITGILAMKLLIYISKKSCFRPFAYYCWAVGLIAVIFG